MKYKNVAIPSDVHRQAAIAALALGWSLGGRDGLVTHLFELFLDVDVPETIDEMRLEFRAKEEENRRDADRDVVEHSRADAAG